MKVATNGARRAATQLRLLAVLLTVGAAIAAAPSGARAGSGPDLQHEGLRAEGLRPEGLVSGLRANGAHVLSLGSRGGLDGYFVTPAKSTGYSLYVTEDGHAVAGLLYGPDGAELTGAQLAAARDKGETTAAVVAHAERGSVVRPSSSASFTELFERSATAFGFTLGERGPLVVLLGDPTCSFSRSAAARLGARGAGGAPAAAGGARGGSRCGCRAPGGGDCRAPRAGSRVVRGRRRGRSHRRRTHRPQQRALR